MPNTPTLDKSVQWRIDAGSVEFRETGYRGTVEAILSSGLATDVVGLISAGKEADVLLTRYNGAPLAVKAYRLYRTSHRGGRPIKLDTMSWWAAHEYEMLHRAWRAGARVPTPARRVENMVSMRYLGDEEGPAPRLKDVRLSDPKGLLADVLAATERLALAGVVHGDLSAYNILLYRGEPWFIDFSDCIRVDRLGASSWKKLTAASELLSRGLRALESYFRRYGLTVDVDTFVSRVIERLDTHGVLR